VIIFDVALAVLALTLLAAIARLVLGPTDADRAVALDFGFYVFVAAIAVLALRLESRPLLDLVLTGTFVGFVATLALAYLLEKRSP
jgi:multicomponent Na+:H+ antiporter subunit F